MISKAIFFEGIPGVGKTMYANKAENYFKQYGINVIHYPDDGSRNPLNLYNCYAIKKRELKKICKQLSIDFVKTRHYGKFEIINEEDVPDNLKDVICEKTVYGGKLKSDEFVNIMCDLFEEFAINNLKTTNLYLFEGVAFRNIIDELYRFSNYDNTRIATEVAIINHKLDKLKPTIFVFQTNFPEKLLKNTLALRTENGISKWYESQLNFIQNSMYGRICKVKEFDDVELYLIRRSNLEELSYINSEWNKYMVNIDDYTLLQRKLDKFYNFIRVEQKHSE